MEIDYSSQQIVAIGPMNVACQYFKAFKFKNEAERIDEIEMKSIEMFRLTPIELHSIITWKWITVHSKSLLLDQ